MARPMPSRTAPFLALAAAAIALAGCTKDEGLYPSLTIRDQERVTGTFTPVEAAPYVPPAPGAETLGRVGRLRADAQAAHTRFLAVAERTRGTAAAGRGAEEGSEAWSVAQVAIAELSSARSDTMIPLAELDILYVTAETDGIGTAEIEQARGEVEGLVAAEDRTINGLSE